MRYISLIVITLLAFTGLQAQNVKKEKKEKQEKQVKVNVKQDGERKVTIVTDEDGEEKVIEWTDKGEIPEDVRKKLEEEGINVEILDSDGEKVWVEVDSDGKGKKEKVIKIKKGSKGEGDGKVMFFGDDGDIEVITDEKYNIVIVDDEGKTIEWNGEGEMPEELKKHMKEHNVEIEEIHEGRGRHRMHRIDRRGDENIRIYRGHEGRGNNMLFLSDENDFMKSKPANVFVGARVENHDEGAAIVEVLDDSPADKAQLKSGDVVTMINGARTRSVNGFLDLLHHFDPGDKIELTVLRDGKSQNLNLTLSARPEDFK